MDMSNRPLVSVVMIFLNEEKYIKEAIESVIEQTYPHWELLLVDDGSTDKSVTIAMEYASRMSEQVRYLTHPNRGNLGMSASRNLGIQHSKGKYLAFLDADDIWLPHKLEDQVGIMEAHSDVGMLYGQTLYWYSWSIDEKDRRLDFYPRMGADTNTKHSPIKLLPKFIDGRVSVPCMCSILVQKSVANMIGGFEENFRGMYEDQAFYAKVCLKVPIYVTDVCWDKYRQHSSASTYIARQNGQEVHARRIFLLWLVNYLNSENIQDFDIWLAVNRELWKLNYPYRFPTNLFIQKFVRLIMKWILRLEEKLLPISIRHYLWIKKQKNTQFDVWRVN
jgi:glycosyltransferase involved in cell wall biosynthesis